MAQAETLARMQSILQRSLIDRPDLAAVRFSASMALEDIGLDSLTVLDLIYDLQQEFNCDGDVRDLAGIRTVEELADYFETRER